MDIKLQIVFICASILTFVFIIRQIRKYDLGIDESIVWILWAILLLIFSIFPDFTSWISRSLGFMSPSNFIICLFVFYLYILLFRITIEISKLKNKQKEIIQKLSLQEIAKLKDMRK